VDLAVQEGAKRVQQLPDVLGDREVHGRSL
jgi:hypothetical protein